MSSFLGQLLHGHPRALSLVKCLDVVSQLLRRPSGQQAAHGYLCYKRFESINADKPDLEVLCSAKVFLVKAALEMPETRSTLMPYCALQVHLLTGIPRASIPYTCVYITDNGVLHTKYAYVHLPSPHGTFLYDTASMPDMRGSSRSLSPESLSPCRSDTCDGK